MLCYSTCGCTVLIYVYKTFIYRRKVCQFSHCAELQRRKVIRAAFKCFWYIWVEVENSIVRVIACLLYHISDSCERSSCRGRGYERTVVRAAATRRRGGVCLGVQTAARHLPGPLGHTGEPGPNHCCSAWLGRGVQIEHSRHSPGFLTLTWGRPTVEDRGGWIRCHSLSTRRFATVAARLVVYFIRASHGRSQQTKLNALEESASRHVVMYYYRCRCYVVNTFTVACYSAAAWFRWEHIVPEAVQSLIYRFT